MSPIGVEAGDPVPRRGGPRRAGRRAARGRAGRARPGLHPGRRRHRQDPRDHPPHRLRRAHRRRTRPSRCSRSPSPPARPASCAAGCARSASAACRPAPSTRPRCGSCSYFGPRVLGGPMPDAGREQAAAGRRTPPRGRGCRTDRAELRDLASEIEWAKATLAAPDDYPAAAPRRPAASRRSTPAAVAAVYAEYEAGQAARRRARLRGPAAVTACALEEHRGRRRARSAPSTGTSSSTSTRTSPRCSSGCSTPGSAAATTSAWSATPTRPSTPSPAPTPTTCWLRRPLSRRRRRPAGARLPLHPAGGRAGQPADRPGAAAQGPAGLRLLGQRPDGPEPTFAEYDDEPAEAAAVAAALPRADRRGHAGGRDRGAVPDQRPVRGLRAGAGRRRRALRAARAASGSSTGPRSARRVLLLRGAAARRQRARRRRCPSRCATCSACDRLGRARPPPGGAARERWESLAALVDLAERPGRPTTPTPDLAELRRRPRPRAPTRSTRRPSRASRSPRCTRPRAWSGTPSSSSGWSTARCRSRTPRPPAQSRRSAGCSTSASPGPGSSCPVLGAGPQPAAPSAARPPQPVPRRGSRPDSGADRARSRKRAGQAAQGGARGRGTRELFERLRAWRSAGGPGRVGAGVRRVHRRDAAGHRRDPAGRTCASWRDCPASGRASWSSTAPTCSPTVDRRRTRCAGPPRSVNSVDPVRAGPS